MSDGHHNQTLAEVSALKVKVGNIDADVRDINDRIVGLDQKLDKAVTSLGSEFRSALSSLGGQLTERNRTPWGTLITAAGFISATLGFIGNQALDPMRADLKALKEHTVPREEITFRSKTSEARLDRLENLASQLASRRYDEMQRQIDRLERQNDSLKSSSR
jgi:hypothetical protein